MYWKYFLRKHQYYLYIGNYKILHWDIQQWNVIGIVLWYYIISAAIISESRMFVKSDYDILSHVSKKLIGYLYILAKITVS